MKALKIWIVGSILCCTCFTTVEAALPPLYQSLKEYKALIESPELSQQLGAAAVILNITRESNGFIVVSSRKTLLVDVVYDPQDHAGPAKFHLVFHTSTED